MREPRAPLWDGIEHHRLFMERHCVFVTNCVDCAFGFEGSREDSAMMWRTHIAQRGRNAHVPSFTLRCACTWEASNRSTGMLDAQYLDHIVEHKQQVMP